MYAGDKLITIYFHASSRNNSLDSIIHSKKLSQYLFEKIAYVAFCKIILSLNVFGVKGCVVSYFSMLLTGFAIYPNFITFLILFYLALEFCKHY
jgi:hypothetical protein